MDVLIGLILACSVHYDDSLVEALAMKMSLANQYFVGDLTTLNTYDTAHSVTEAHQIVDAIIAKGGRPAVGYMSVPVAWAARFGRTTDDLFDGCVNVGIATAMLSEYQRSCTVGPDHHRRHDRRHSRQSEPATSPGSRYCVLRRLEADLDITGVVEHVLPDVAKLDAKARDPDEDAPPARSSVFPDNTNTARLHETVDWSSPRLFAPSPTTPPPASPIPAQPRSAPASPVKPPAAPLQFACLRLAASVAGCAPQVLVGRLYLFSLHARTVSNGIYTIPGSAVIHRAVLLRWSVARSPAACTVDRYLRRLDSRHRRHTENARALATTILPLALLIFFAAVTGPHSAPPGRSVPHFRPVGVGGRAARG